MLNIFRKRMQKTTYMALCGHLYFLTRSRNKYRHVFSSDPVRLNSKAKCNCDRIICCLLIGIFLFEFSEVYKSMGKQSKLRSGTPPDRSGTEPSLVRKYSTFTSVQVLWSSLVRKYSTIPWARSEKTEMCKYSMIKLYKDSVRMVDTCFMSDSLCCYM